VGTSGEAVNLMIIAEGRYLRMKSKLRDSIYISGLEEEIAQIVETTPKPGMEQAMTELIQVLKHCNREVTDCIPKELYDFLEQYGDKEWKGNLDFSLNLNDMNLFRDTRVLLSMVYRDFLCSDEERMNLIDEERREAETMGESYEYESLLDLIRSAG